MPGFDVLKSNPIASLLKRVGVGGGEKPVAPGGTAGAVFGADKASLSQDAVDMTGLNEEEIRYVREGFLPANFAALRKVQREQGKDAAKALFRQGKKGPFEKRYGDPDVMFDGARRWAKHPELGRLVKTLKPGDILLTTWNKDKDAISVGTKGPFIHALVCTSADPVPEFVEALGMSGDVKDPTSNKVLHSMMSTQAYDDQTSRVIRPTEGMPPVEAEKAIKRAIAYAEGQLGKPYDFSFTNTNGRGMNDAFYCSELAYKAYADPKGADMRLPVSKSSERDETLSAVSDILDGLKPDDKNGLVTEIAKMAAAKPMDEAKLVDFIVDKVAPGTEATRKIANTPERRAALKAAVEKVIAGKAFDRVEGAIQQFSKDEQAGRFKGIGGFFRRLGGFAKIGWNGVKDVRALTKGVGFWRTIGVTWRLGKTLVPHAETLTKFLFGPDDARTKKARGTLDKLDAMDRDVRRVPLIGGLLGKLWPLPARPRKEANRDFVSPTDLAWAKVPHYDFNVKKETPIDQAAVEQKAKAGKK